MVLLVKNSPANAGDAKDRGSIPELGRCTGGGNGNPLQYSGLENPRPEKPGGLQFTVSQRSHTIEETTRASSVIFRQPDDTEGSMPLSQGGCSHS